MVCVEGVEERGGYRGMGAGVRVWRETHTHSGR